MAYTSELTVASLNAALIFSPGAGEERLNQGFRAIGAMGDDVQVLGIAELASDTTSETHLDVLRAGMDKLGYKDSEITDGVREDSLKLSIWTRIPGEVGRLALTPASGDKLYLPQILVPGFGRVVAIHQPSTSEPRRIEIAQALIEAIDREEVEDKGIVVLGDWNATYPGDTGTTRLMRALDPAVRQIPKFTEIDYFDKSKRRKWVAGAAIRACAMARGTTMRVLTDNGFSDAAPSGQSEPTVFLGPVKMRVDHIMGRGVSFEDYTVLPRATDENGAPLSDHAPVKATGRAKQ